MINKSYRNQPLNRLISIFLLLSILIQLFPSVSSSAGLSEQSFNAYVQSLGKPLSIVKDGNEYAVSYSTYNYYGVIAYGSPFGEYKKRNRDPTDGVCIHNEFYFRNLGYNEDNGTVTNPCFQNDANGTGPIEDRNWQVVDNGLTTWNQIQPPQTSRLLTGTLDGNGATQKSFTVSSTGGAKYAQVLVAPTLCTRGSVKMQHKTSDGKYWYATFFVDALGSCEGNLNVTVDTPATTYTIPKDQSSVTISGIVGTSSVVFNDLFTKDYVSTLKTYLAIDGSNIKTASNSKVGSVPVSNSITINRSDLGGSGTKTITIKATGVLTAFGQDITNTATKTITVTAVSIDGEVTANCICDPDNVKFAGSDIAATATINASITGVSSSLISSWKLYARKEEDTSSSTVTTAAATSASNTFSFTIPASVMTGDSYTQKFVLSAVVYFKDGTYKKASVTCQTVIYKDTPPPSTEPDPSDPPPPPPVIMDSGPVAIITAPTLIKAGRPLPFPISGESSFDWDSKSIVMYTWDHTYAQAGPIYNKTFNTPGTETITLNVKNSANAWSEDTTHTITVVPDEPPVAMLTVPSENTRLSSVRVQSSAYSPDGDTVVSHAIEMKYDSDNDNSFADELWKSAQTGASNFYTFLPSKVGKYLFRETVCEEYGNCANNDSQPETERTINVLNLAPSLAVSTASDLTDTKDRQALTMSDIYNNGSLKYLTGATGVKDNWVLSGGNLSTRNYRSNIGMFNNGYQSPDAYFGEDMLNTTLFSSIQSMPTAEYLGGITPNDIFAADELYIYKMTSIDQNPNFSFAITAYDKNMQVVWTNSYGPVVTTFINPKLTKVMIKGDYIYITGGVSGNQSGHRYINVVNRLNGNWVSRNLYSGGPNSPVPSNAMNNHYGRIGNDIFATNAGVYGVASPIHHDGWFQGGTDYFNENFRAGFDMANPVTAPFYTRTYGTMVHQGGFYSQDGNSLTHSGYGVAPWILYNKNGIQVGSLEDPPGGLVNCCTTNPGMHFLGVDGQHNFYTVGYPHSTFNIAHIFVHDSSGHFLRSYPVPTAIRTAYTYNGGQTYFYTLDETKDPLVDKVGNIWINNGSSIYVIKPDGTGMMLVNLTVNGAHTGLNDKMIVGADGLVTAFVDHYASNGSYNNLQIVVIDPNTYNVVFNNTLVDLLGARGQTPRHIFTPIGDQAYIMHDPDNQSHAYLIRANGLTNYAKPFTVGTPSKDYWLSSGQVASNYSFEGDLKLNSASSAGVGYIYRAQDVNNYYSVELESGQLKVVKTVNGSATTVFTKAYTAVTGQTYTFKFVPEANGFAVYVNKLKQATIPETVWTTGKYGMMNRGQNYATFGNAFTEKVSASALGKIEGIVLVGGTLNYTVTYEDPESDPRIIAGESWMYTHNPNVFLNPEGIWSGSGQPQSSPVTTFDLPGEYTFKFKTKDDPHPSYLNPSTVFAGYRHDSNEVEGVIRVHRSPLAIFGVTSDTTGKLTYSNTSYDPDRYNPSNGQYSMEATGINYATNHGILVERWRYRMADSSTYINSKPNKMTVSGTYVIELAVQDEYGAWSDWAVQTITLTATPIMPPLPGFTIDPLITYRSVVVSISSTASDPQDGARKNIAHLYYISNLTTGSAETLQSSSRTDWTKIFNSMGLFQFRQVVTNSYGITAEMTQTMNVVNRKPVTTVTTPASTNIATPTMFTTQRPQFQWSYMDADSDLQNQYHLQIYLNNGTLQLDSGLIIGSIKSWTPSTDLPDNTSMYVRARTYDGYEWGDWSTTKYFRIETNKPPIADFAWSPNPVYEGDHLSLANQSSDPDGDLLSSIWTVTGPVNFTAVTGSSENMVVPGGSTANIPGVYTVKLTVSDPDGASASVTKTIVVRPLGIQGTITHTEAWEKNRLRYNEKYPDDPRAPHWFWAGEAFVMEATVTDTGASLTKPISVKAAATPQLQKNLTANVMQPNLWNGLLLEEDTGITFSQLPEGPYVFVFTVTYSNGVTKTATASIQLVNTVDDYVQVHRIQ